MKTKIYKILYFFCVSIIVFVYTFNVYSLISWADVPSGQIVVGNSGTWSALPFNFSSNGKYYTVDDPTGIPTSTYVAPNYFYTVDNEKFFVVNGLKLFTGVLNNLVGIIYEPNELNTLFTGFLNATGGTDTTNNKYARNCLYDSNDNFLGIALNDISGCYYGGNPPSGSNVKDDGNYSNNVKNYIDYQKSQGNFDIPDYFTFYGISDTYIMQHLGTAFNSEQLHNYQQFRYDNDFIYGLYFNRSYGTFKFYGLYNSLDDNITGFNDVTYLVNKNDNYFNNWNNFVSKNVVSYEILASEFIYSSPSGTIYFDMYDSNNNQITTGNRIQPYTQSTSASVNINNNDILCFSTSPYIFFPFNFEKITVYKDQITVNQFETNLYTPNVYYTDSFNNYDSANDNSIDMSITQINQSTDHNTSIYDNSAENFYNYYDNGVYDQSSATTNITNITNNYYGDGGGDNPDNPDDPDDPDDPSDVLSQILQALLRFFTAIGSVLGTILAGILSIFSEILESIATVTEDLTGISDFFGSIFAWLPDPVPQVLGLGFFICVLCGIIKFIRG